MSPNERIQSAWDEHELSLQCVETTLAEAHEALKEMRATAAAIRGGSEEYVAQLREACEQAEHWITEEAKEGITNGGEEILRVLRTAIAGAIGEQTSKDTFCACGRRASECDGSRAGCVKRLAEEAEALAGVLDDLGVPPGALVDRVQMLRERDVGGHSLLHRAQEERDKAASAQELAGVVR